MPTLVERLRSLGKTALKAVKDHADLLAPVVLILLGLTLGVASLTAVESVVYTQPYAGNLAPGNVTLNLPVQDATFLRINMSIANCPIQLYPATGTQSFLFNTTGILPPTWIGCMNRTTSAPGNITNLILVNNGNTSLTYAVEVQATLIDTPYGWLALPATAIALAGLLIFVPRVALLQALRFRDRERKRKW